MYKTKLQELCHKRRWHLPTYSTAKEGRPHEARFLGTVCVNGQNFVTPAYCRSGKEAKNTAAEIAYQHLYYSLPQYGHDQVVNPNLAVARPASLPAVMPQDMPLVFVPPVQVASPPPSATPMPKVCIGLLGTKNDAHPTIPNSGEPVPQMSEETTHTSNINRGHVDFTCNKEVCIGLLGTKNDAHPTIPNSGEPVPQMPEETTHTSNINRGHVDFTCNKEMLHNYKNMLQEYAQKHILGLPVYTREVEGPPHNRRFKVKVSLNGKSFGALESFPTLKEAEQAAAKLACQDQLVNQGQEDGWSYKRLLNEFAQKKNLRPTYETSNHGSSHMPVFTSSVNIGTNTFRGAEAKTKKQAETNAAKVAYYALIGPSHVNLDLRHEPAVIFTDPLITKSSNISSGNQSVVVDNEAPAIQQTTMGEKRKNSEGPSHVNVPSCDPHLPYDGVDNPASVDPIDVQQSKRMRENEQ